MDERSRRLEARFELPVLAAALATIPALLVEQLHPVQPWKTLAEVTDWIIWLVFALEVGAMLAVVPSKRRWLSGNVVGVAIVLLTVPLLSTAFQSIRLLRILRLLRLARVPSLSRRLFSGGGIRFASFMALICLIGGAEAFASAENISVGNGIYWALTTMTTVGYGDISPKTATGKVVAGVLMLVGIGFFAIITGAIAQRFLAAEVTEVEAAVSEVETTETFLLKEIAEITDRLRTLEAAVRRQMERDGAS